MVQIDYCTNIHHTFKKNPLKLGDLQEFATCYSAGNRFKCVETYHAVDDPEGKGRKFGYGEIVALNKISLNITC